MMKETKMKRVPKLRFPEFTDDWEKRKYAEIIELLSGQDFNPEEYNEDGIGIPYLTGASCIVNGCTTAVRWTEKPRCIAEKGDTVLVCKGSGYGAIATVTQKKAHIARQFMALKVKKYELDNRFNYFLLNSVVENIKTDARGLIAGIARDAVLKQEIDIPCLNEQKKIGEYFSYLDHLITLHQRKFKTLKKLKEGVMQKLFSQEVRFKADDGSDYPNWKTKKIGDVCTQIKETIDPMANPKKLFVEYSMPAFDNEMKPEVVYGNTMNSIRKVIGSPCVLINKLNVRKRRIWNIVNPEDNAVCSAEFVPLTSEVMNLSFVAYFALTDWFTRYLLECSTGSSNSQKRVTPDVILNIKMSVPCLAEQQKIVDCLSSLDHVIEKQKATLAAWEELKKGLLQQMFV